MVNSHNRIADLIRQSEFSQSELAKRSGVSRIQISRIVNGNVQSIQPRTAKRLAEALGVSKDELSSSRAIDQYRKLILERLSKKSFGGLGLPDMGEQNLESIFVPPHAVHERHSASECDPGTLAANVARDNYADAVEKSNALPVERLIAAYPRLLLLGCPGAGKTTVLEHEAVKLARKEPGTSKYLPIFVRLPEFVAALDIDPTADFLSWIIARTEELGCSGLAEELPEWLDDKERCVLFLFDGLDEVPSESHRRCLVEATLEFVHRHPGNRYCVTSRPIGFDKTPWLSGGFEIARLVEYGDDQIDETIKKWSKVLARGKERAESVGDDLTHAIRENARVRQIAANPLILTILIFLCRSRGYALPRRRVDLYAKVADVFLESWETSKRPTNRFSETINIDLDARELSWLISDLALEMQRKGLVLAKRWWIEQRIVQTLQDRIGLSHEMATDVTGRVLRFISHRTGLLEARALDLFAFSHRTLQEYFAAIGAINEADLGSSQALPQLIRPFLYHPDWVEVVRLIAAQVTPPRAEELVRIILDDPDPTGRLLHRGPLLAAYCLLDGATIANRRLVESVFAGLEDLGKSKWLGITFEAISLLNQLNTTRHAENAEIAIERIVGDARKFLKDEEYEALLFDARSLDRNIELKGVGAEDADHAAVLEFVISSSGVEHPIYVPNFKLLSEDRDVWHKQALLEIEDPQLCVEAKKTAIWQLGTQSKLHDKSRILLKQILRKCGNPDLRACAASALRRCVLGPKSVKKMLLQHLESDQNPTVVRTACALSLAAAVADDPTVRKSLFAQLTSSSDNDIRAAAAHALEGAVAIDETIASTLLEYADNSDSIDLQAACLYSLEPLLKMRCDIQQAFREWARGDDFKARIACQILAEALANGDFAWEPAIVRRIETVMRSLGEASSTFGAPCPHALYALRALMNAWESQTGFRVENVVGDRLQELAERIRFAFIFGSVARNEQVGASDVDLMLIGDISMRTVSSAIKQAEQTLGRSVNPVLYTVETFTRKLHSGDPFLTEVIRQPKIPIRIGGREVSAKELNDELRTMAAERLAVS